MHPSKLRLSIGQAPEADERAGPGHRADGHGAQLPHGALGTDRMNSPVTRTA
jgi:hypothetical protein